MGGKPTYILNIETSSTVCSVSVAQNGKTISLKEENSGFTHAENLHFFIEDVLKNSDAQLKDLSAIAIGMGPGSYTGLRIGMSAAKGLCYALEKPLIGISTLQLMSQQVREENIFDGEVFFFPMTDARRMEVYFSVFDKDLRELQKASALVISAETIAPWQKFPFPVFFGSGMEKCRATLSSLKNAVFIENILPSAKWMEQLSYEKFHAQQFLDVAYSEPEYGKEFYSGK